jgi:hypothetical protein
MPSLPVKLSPLVAVFLVAACAPPPSTENPDFSVEVMENLRSIAAPGQNLATVQLQADGCYWVEHRNPVETTMLPLMTRDARPVCAR